MLRFGRKGRSNCGRDADYHSSGSRTANALMYWQSQQGHTDVGEDATTDPSEAGANPNTNAGAMAK